MSQFLSNAVAATEAMRSLFSETPLQENAHLSARFGATVLLKREDLSPVRSYKIRGAFNAMRKVLAATPDRANFVCASAGNHAQGVAYVAQHFRVSAAIYMPVTTPQQKIDKTRAFGGDNVEIVLTGDYFEQSLAAARAHATKTSAHFLSPFDDDDVIEGQASVAVEALRQAGGPVDMVVLPVGGGGLGAGVTAYLREASPRTTLRYVEPAGGASLAAALEAGVPVTLPVVDNFVDGAAVARIGDAPFRVLGAQPADAVLAAPEDRVCVTMSELLNTEGLVLEPAGALSIDALADLRDQIAGKRVVCVVSGGNFDFERLPEVKERAQRYAGLKKYFVIRMPQRPGALREFLNLLGPHDDISRFEYLKKSARNFGSVLIGIETTEPDGFKGFTARMTDAGIGYRDITEDKVLAEFLI